MISLDLLRTFLAVYRAGSVTGGAALLGVSQPSVTAQVKALEAELGRPLFERLPRGMAPTAAGEELAGTVAGPLDALDSVLAGQLAVPHARAVHLGGPAELVCARVLPLLGPLVAYAENLPILRRYWRVVFGTRLTRTPAVVVPDLRGVLAAVAAGAGVTVLPRYLCAGQLADGQLRLLAEPELAPINTLFLASREGTLPNPAARAVHARLLLAGREW